MKIKNIKEITIKELKSYYDNLSGYLLSGIFLGLLYFLFLKPFFVSQIASLREMFLWLPWMFIIFVPAITMGSFAKEFENQTIEYLLSKPLNKKELIIGKILGAFLYIYITVLLTLPAVYFVSRIGQIDYAETIMGYVGALILALTLSSIGVAVSSMFKNQITAFIFTVVIMFGLVIIGSQLTSINASAQVANILSSLSITEHFNSLTRGVLKASDLAYFLIIIIFSIGLAEYSLNREKGAAGAKIKNNYTVFIGMAIAILAILISSQYMYGRIDLTSARKYTLSETTKKILNTEGKVTIEVYASNNLPPQFKSAYDELKNTLEDYQIQGKNNLDIQYINPEGKEAELQQKGISPVEFRVYGNDQLQAQKGYLALFLKNEEDRSEVLPIVQDINNLEYDLSRLIYRLKVKDKPKIALAAGNSERNGFEDYSVLKQLLESDYIVQSVYIPGISEEAKEQVLPNLSEFKILVIANPDNEYTPESKKKIKEFIDNGGSVIYLADSININQNTALPEEPTTPRGKILSEYGATINKDIVYDTKSHGMITVQTIEGIIPIRYPLFVFGQLNTKDIKDLPENLLMGWPSSLNLDDNWKILYQTSATGGVQTENFDIRPDQNFTQNDLKNYPLIAMRQLEKGNKLFIISTARIFDNQFVEGIEQNAVFALKIFEEAYGGIGLSSIKARNVTNNQILYVTMQDKNLMNYGTPVTSILLLGLIGLTRYKRRQNLIKYYKKI